MPKRKPQDRSESLQSREAFEIFYALTPEQRATPLQAYVLLASKLHVNPSTVQNWAKLYQWERRSNERDDEVMTRVAERTIEKAVDTILYYHSQLSHLAKEWFRQRLHKKDIREATLATMKVSDIRAVIDLDMSLLNDKRLLDYLNGTQESAKNAEKQVKDLSTEQLTALAKLGDTRPANQPVAIGSGPAGTGRA